MTETPKPEEIEVLNPRYAGATPEAVGRALLRHDPQAEEREEESARVTDEPDIQSSI